MSAGACAWRAPSASSFAVASLSSVATTVRRAVEEDEAYLTDALLALIRLESVAPHEEGAQSLLAQLARDSGLEASLLPIPDSLAQSERYYESGMSYSDRSNLEIRLPGGDAAPVVLNSHIDTVNPTEAWTRDRGGEVDGSRIYGLGAADAKGGLLAALGAARAIRRLGLKPKGDVIIQSVIEEEGSGNGTLAALLARPRGYRLAIVIEPTQLNVARGHRGMAIFEVVCRGVAAHSATGGGVSAIASAARTVVALEAAQDSLASIKAQGFRASSLNVGVVEGGQEVYTVPDLCVLQLSLRYAPRHRAKAIGIVQQALTSIDRLERLRGASLEFRLVTDFDGCQTTISGPLPSAFIKAVRSVTSESEVSTLDGGCDARHFVNLAHTPTLIFGPGSLSNAHGPDEYVERQEVIDAAAALGVALATV